MGGTEWAININIDFFWHYYLGQNPWQGEHFVKEHFQCFCEKLAEC